MLNHMGVNFHVVLVLNLKDLMTKLIGVAKKNKTKNSILFLRVNPRITQVTEKILIYSHPMTRLTIPNILHC